MRDVARRLYGLLSRHGLCRVRKADIWRDEAVKWSLGAKVFRGKIGNVNYKEVQRDVDMYGYRIAYLGMNKEFEYFALWKDVDSFEIEFDGEELVLREVEK